MVAFLFYRYYSEGPNPDSTPYFRTLGSMTLLIFIHIFHVLAALGKMDIIPIDASDSKPAKWLIIFLMMAPIYLFLSFLIKRKELEKMVEKYDYSWDKVFNWNVWLIVYIILSFALTIFIGFWKR